jgi:NDP-sugar pyrophosphorylase family protein
MQTVYVCGGRGTRLRPKYAGPKSLVPIAGISLFERLVATLSRLHRSSKPPVVIVDSSDRETPSVARALVPQASIVTQPRPDGVANALLLAEHLLDELILVTLGDLVIDGTLDLDVDSPTLVCWRQAPEHETRKNFGVAVTTGGGVKAIVEKPVFCDGLQCGMGIYALTRAAVASFRRAEIDPRTHERGITAGLQAAIHAGGRFRAVDFCGYYNNINSEADVDAAEEHLATRPTLERACQGALRR